MSDSKETKDLKSDGMAAIPLRYQGLSGKVSYGFRILIYWTLNMPIHRFQKTSKRRAVLGSSLQFQADGFLLNTICTKGSARLSFLKIRASYGIVGNDRISTKRFPYLTIINENAEAGWGYNNKGISENQMGADNLRWGKSQKNGYWY